MDRQTEFVLRTLEERDIRFVRLWFTDVLGFLKSVAIAPADARSFLWTMPGGAPPRQSARTTGSSISAASAAESRRAHRSGGTARRSRWSSHE